jgi:hypothetical protein
MPFIHDIGLQDESYGWRQNWYPKNKNFMVNDNHSMCRFSLCFDSGDVHYLAPSDQNMLYTLTVPLNMRCKAELLYYEGEPWKVRLTELTAEEEAAAVASEEAQRTERSRMYFREQSVQQDSSSH